MPSLFWSICVLFSFTIFALGIKAPTGKFIHVTDFHLDQDYKQGSSPKELCHRGSGDAGLYGAVRTDCDAPEELVELTFEFIRNHLSDADFVIFTGDSARHDRDDKFPRTLDQVLGAQKAIVKYFNDTFDLNQTKVLPVIGNNDVHPHNTIGANDPQYKAIESIWKPFALNTTTDFQRGGYFVQDVIPGKLRTVHTNTLLFFKDNKKNTQDCSAKGSLGAMHLKWLTKVLDDSRKQGYKVYVLAHIPPRSKKDKPYFTPQCLNSYLDLLGLYKDTIVGHFAGHYNNDIISAIVEKDGQYQELSALAKKKKALKKSDIKGRNFVTPLFNTPSVIPTFNPSIRVFQYDLEGKDYAFGTIRDWWQYYLNLGGDGAVAKQPKYELEYQASTVFHVDHFDGDGLEKIFRLIVEDHKALEEYREHATVSTKKKASKDKKNNDDD
ncbi:Metallo-dependent phosphatase-like protein [Dichotomocladium elegans]|nr:Metallo-dependent phosphatase-like protein [Dichotomocladium elegans]